MKSLCALLLALASFAASPAKADEPRKTRNVIVVTLDGFRWQEFFGGAQDGFIDKEAGGVREVADLRRRYVRKSLEESREVLLPFIWGTIARQGQIFGDPSRQAAAVSTNGKKFSYPGYSEMFCGLADERINSNGKHNNSNLSVLEFLQGRPGFEGRVAAFCTWDVFPFIYLRDLWQTLQEHPDYRDCTTLLLTTDHGRGSTRVDWTDHGEKVPGAEQIWMALLGPDTPPLGVRENVRATQSQVASRRHDCLDVSRPDPRAANHFPKKYPINFHPAGKANFDSPAVTSS